MLESLVKQLKELRVEKDEKETALSLVNEQIQEVKGKILSFLDSSGLSSGKTDFGSVSKREIRTPVTPKTAEEKAAFKEWLIQKVGQEGAEAMLSINSQTLKSLVNKEIEERLEAGNPDQSIPGISAINTHYDVSFRSK